MVIENNKQSRGNKYPEKEAFKYLATWMDKKGVDPYELAEAVVELQKPFISDLTFEEASNAVYSVTSKWDFLNAFMTGVEIDRLATEHKLSEPLQSIIKDDLGVYSIDEILALSICEIYGGIAISTFGYLDKKKRGVAKKLDEDTSTVNVFLDDIVSAIIASACGKVAHDHQ